MKAVVVEQFGGPETLVMTEFADPAPASNEVVIETRAISVGYQDVMLRNGSLASHGIKPGIVPGGEVAGIVTAIGQDVDPAWLGKSVWAFIGLGGGYATHARAAVAELIELPAGLDPIRAVTLGTAGVVAHYGLDHAGFAPGQSVMVRGAGGPLGIMTVQLAAKRGASVIAVTASTSARGDRLRELGATQVLDRAGNEADAQNVGYDVIVDVVAGADTATILQKLNPSGRMVVIGAVAGPPSDVSAAMFANFQKSWSFATFSANAVSPQDRRAMTRSLFAAVERDELQTVVDDVLPLDDAAKAHRRLEAGGVFGRIVLTPA